MKTQFTSDCLLFHVSCVGVNNEIGVVAVVFDLPDGVLRLSAIVHPLVPCLERKRIAPRLRCGGGESGQEDRLPSAAEG